MTDINRIETFLVEYARLLHASGSPAPELETQVNRAGARLGVQSVTFALPTMLSVTLEDPCGRQRLRQIRLPASDYNMSRLIDLAALLGDITGPASLERAEERLRHIRETPAPWRGPRMDLSAFLLSATVAALFRGGYTEILCAGIVGLVFHRLHIVLSHRRSLGPVIPVLLCAVSAFLAKTLCLALPNQSVFITLVAGVIYLMPGFITTISLTEIASHSLLSGSARLAGAMLLLLMMAAGAAIGVTLADSLLPAVVAQPGAPAPEPVFWSCVALLGVSFMGVLQTPVNSVLAAMLASLTTWIVWQQAGAALGPIGGSLLAAMYVALGGHVHRRLFGKPAQIFQATGLLTLVPGSVGFRALDKLIRHDALEGVEIATAMILTATALAVGFLLGNGLAPLIFPAGAGERRAEAEA